MFATLPTVLEHIRASRLRGLGVTSARRFPGAPEFPTIAEAGLAGYEVSGWSGMFAPAGTPRAVIERLARETARILREPELKKRFLTQGADAAGEKPPEFSAVVGFRNGKREKKGAVRRARPHRAVWRRLASRAK